MRRCAYGPLCYPGSSCARSCGLRWKLIPEYWSWRRRNDTLEAWLDEDGQQALDGGRTCPIDPLELLLAPVTAVYPGRGPEPTENTRLCFRTDE